MTDLTLGRPAVAGLPVWLREAAAWLSGSWAHVALVGGIPLTSWAHWQLAILVGVPVAGFFAINQAQIEAQARNRRWLREHVGF